MKIANFKITNFKSLVNFDISLGETTILFGANNVGKSNVLNALHTIFARKKKVLDDGSFSSLENFYEGIIENFSNSFYNLDKKNTISFEVILMASNEELIFEKEIDKLKKSDNVFIIKGNIKPHPTINDIAEIFLSQVKINGILVFKEDKSDITYFPTLDKNKSRQGELRNTFTNLINPLNDCVRIINSERGISEAAFNTDNVEKIDSKTFKNFLYNLYLNRATHDLFEKINKLFNDEPFKFGEISFSKEGNNLEVMLKKDGLRLPISAYGSSVLQTLFIISCIVYMGNKIICIEELEQNLSPRLQAFTLKKIKSLISNNELNQIIVSSHSSVYAKKKIGDVYFLEKKDGKTIIKPGFKKEEVIPEVKEHFSHAQTYVPPTKEEWEQFKKDIKRDHDFW